MGWWTAWCKLFHVNTIVRESHSFELSDVKKKKTEKHFCDFLFWCLMSFHTIRSLVGHQTRDEWYIVIKAYKFAMFMILRDFIVYSVSAISLCIESTSTTNSMICNIASTTIHYHRFLSNRKFTDGPICIPSTLQHGIQLASFPAFALWLACTDNTRNGRAWRPERIHHVSDVRWMQVGCRGAGPKVNSGRQSARLSPSLLVETTDAVDNTAQPRWNLLAVGPHPPTSTQCCSRDEFSQAFPFFTALPLPCITVTQTEKQETGQAWERG